MASDWLLAFRIALAGQAMLLLVGVVVALIRVFQQTAAAGLDAVDWPAAAVTPVLVVLGFSGAGAGEPLSVTAVLYAFLAYRLAFRGALPVMGPMLSDRVRVLSLPAKIGALAAAVLVATGILINSLVEDLVWRASAPGLSSSIDLTTLVFFAWFVGIVAGLAALASASRTPLTRLLGLTMSAPTLVRVGIVGARRTLVVGAIGLLALSTLGSLLDSLSVGGVTLSRVIATILGTINGLLVGWLDSALMLLLGASKFLHDGGFLWAPLAADIPAWMWLAIPVLLVAYVAGGIQAAKRGQPRTQAEAAKAALLVGPGVAAVSLLAAIGWAGQPFIEDIVPIAILLPSLWGLVALGGAWLWANQQGLPSGLVVERPQQPYAQHDVSPPSGASPQPGGPETWAPPQPSSDRAHWPPPQPTGDTDEPAADGAGSVASASQRPDADDPSAASRQPDPASWPAPQHPAEPEPDHWAPPKPEDGGDIPAQHASDTVPGDELPSDASDEPDKADQPPVDLDSLPPPDPGQASPER